MDATRSQKRYGRLKALCFSVMVVNTAAATAEQSPDIEPAYIRDNLADAVKQTGFSALARHVGVHRVESGEHEQVFLYSLEIQEVFRGPQSETLTYKLIAEPGETADLSSDWVIVTLCRTEDGYEWPGTGAIFPATEALIDAARAAGRKTDPEQSYFAHCDWD